MRAKATLFFAACLFAGMAFAQTTGTIQGKIVTTDGDELPGVTVVIESSKMIGTRTDVSRADGSFLFRRVPPGEYVITSTMVGMQTDKTTITVGLGGVSSPTIIMSTESTQEVMQVTATVDPVLDTVEVSSHFEADFVNKIAGERDQSAVALLSPGVTFNGGSGDSYVSISGANAGANTYLINGADSRFDNIRSQAGNAIILDSIQETQVLTGAISAEYGQFGGGVVNTLTKSGGNEFSGSYRLAMTNNDWEARTPNELEDNLQKEDDINMVHSATVGGPILKDRIWFFLAGQTTESTIDSNYLSPTPLPDRAAIAYGLEPGQTAPGVRAIPNRVDEDERIELKFSGRIAEGHDLSVSLVTRDTTQVNNPQSAFDISATATRSITREQRAFTYNGTFTPEFSVEAMYSDRESVFEARAIPAPLQAQLDAGEDIRIVGTNLRYQRGNRPHTNSPQFLGKPDEPRSNETLRFQANYFLVTDNFGTHDLTAGYQNALDERFADNRQYVNDWAFWSDFRYEGETAIPIYSPTSADGRYQTRLMYFPIEQSSKTTSFETDSLFINDTLTLNDKLRFNIGFRYDKNEGYRSDGVKSVDDDIIAPRLSINYDLHGDGKHEFNASYSVYAQRIGSAADDGAQAGSPSTAWLAYGGPQTEDYRDVIQWINDTYGEDFFFDPLGHPNTAEWEADLVSSTINRGVLNSPDQVFGTVNPNGGYIPGALQSPNTEEIRFGYSTRFGNKGFLKVDYVHRDFKDFYTDNRNLLTGPTNNGNNDLNVINNEDDRYNKQYDAIQTAFRWRFNETFQVSGNYTWSQLIGNTAGGTTDGILTTVGDFTIYPEYNDFEQRSPRGYLPGDQRHVANLFAVYNWTSPVGVFDFALSERIASGSPYDRAWTLDLRQFDGEYGLPERGSLGYVQPPTSTTYYLSRGADRGETLYETNLGINWSLRLFSKVSMFVELDVINVFNSHAENVGWAFNTQIDELAPFNVYNETPVEGVHYELSDDFGRANSKFDYQRPRRFKIDVGFRF
jgi:outer membrane receptor for ferrienterochelin and colicin